MFNLVSELGSVADQKIKGKKNLPCSIEIRLVERACLVCGLFV